jgi:hypothetical protein
MKHKILIGLCVVVAAWFYMNALIRNVTPKNNGITLDRIQTVGHKVYSPSEDDLAQTTNPMHVREPMPAPTKAPGFVVPRNDCPPHCDSAEEFAASTFRGSVNGPW